MGPPAYLLLYKNKLVILLREKRNRSCRGHHAPQALPARCVAQEHRAQAAGGCMRRVLLCAVVSSRFTLLPSAPRPGRNWDRLSCSHANHTGLAIYTAFYYSYDTRWLHESSRRLVDGSSAPSALSATHTLSESIFWRQTVH